MDMHPTAARPPARTGLRASLRPARWVHGPVRGWASGAMALALAGCAVTDASIKSLTPTPPVHQAERFDSASPHARRHERSAADLCEGARRALMSQGYVLSRNDRAVLVGRKFFQPEKDRHVELQVDAIEQRA